ncbi:MAG: CBS domain-containing protein [Burkholderiaceae bacterium]|nr:CBS domain-containing protein [Burkholderiaceae bacterium]
MFFVFGPSGQMFRGGPENLSQITAVRRVQRPQAVRSRWEDAADEMFGSPAHSGMHTEAAGHRPPAAPATPEPPTLLAQDAISAYTQTEHGPVEARQPLTLVSDVMTVHALSVLTDATVNDAWRTLAAHGVSQAPVVDALGRVVGLLMRADMLPLDLLPEPGSAEAAIELARRPVSEVMASPVPTVSADTELRRVAGALLSTGLPGLPVTDELGVLAGFISRTDILQAVAADPPLDLWIGPAVRL